VPRQAAARTGQSANGTGDRISPNGGRPVIGCRSPPLRR